MKPPHHPRHRRLEFSTEYLELRQMLAGNVTAIVDAADRIIIRGDAADNKIVIEATSDDFVWLRGIDGTTINGDAGPELIDVNGALSRDVQIDLRGGDDEFTFNQVQLLGEVDLRMGGGDDLVLINEVFAFDEHRIDLGAGVDRFGAANTVMQRDFTILGQGGGDFMQLTEFVSVDDVSIHMGGGSDELQADRITITGRLEIRDSGGGDDTVELEDLEVRDSLRVSLVSGDDNVSIQSFNPNLADSGFAMNEFSIQTTGGNDVIDLEQTYVGGAAIQITTGSGDDRLVMSKFSGNALQADLQSGADQAELNEIYLYSARELRLSLGSGNDQLRVSRLDLSGDYGDDGSPAEAFFDGGSGADRMLFTEGCSYLFYGEREIGYAPLRITTGAGNDLLAFVDFRSLTQDIDLGSGSDQLMVIESGGDDEWSIVAGSGHDTILISDGHQSDRLSVATGSGRDTLAVGSPGSGAFHVDNFQADMGRQNDLLYIYEDLPLSGSINGGAGFDTFQEDLSVLVHLQPASFEEILPDQPIASVWSGLSDDFLAAWIDAGGEIGDLDSRN